MRHAKFDYFIRKVRTVTESYEVYRANPGQKLEYLEKDARLHSSHQSSTDTVIIEAFRPLNEIELALIKGGVRADD